MKMNTAPQYSALLVRIRVNLGLGSYLSLESGYPV